MAVVSMVCCLPSQKDKRKSVYFLVVFFLFIFHAGNLLVRVAPQIPHEASLQQPTVLVRASPNHQDTNGISTRNAKTTDLSSSLATRTKTSVVHIKNNIINEERKNTTSNQQVNTSEKNSNNNDFQVTQESDPACRQVLENFETYKPYQIHKLRRQLYHKCSKAVQDKFIDHAMKRQSLPIYYHHIPKSAGSFMCELAKLNFGEDRVHHYTNCNVEQLGPRWAGVMPRYRTCQDIAKLTQGNVFFANERFLDYHKTDDSFFCDSFRFVISLREIVSRVSAHFNHMRRKVLQKHPLALNNYLTWALVVSKHGNNTKEYSQKPIGVTKPEQSWLETAVDVLYGYDFVLGMDRNDTSCQDIVLRTLGFSTTTMASTVNAADKNTYFQHNSTEIQEYNSMDMHLYQVGQSIIQSDCEFAKEVWKRSSQTKKTL